MIKRLKDVHAFISGAAAMSDHFLVERKLKVREEWGSKVGGRKRQVVKVDELSNRGKELDY